MKKRTLKEKFWPKVNVLAPDECWRWMGAIFKKSGYGQVWWGPKKLLAHRVSWVINKGPIPIGMNVCHHCDNPICVNPNHLFLGTTLDNIRDKMQKGRHRCHRGESHANAKLTAVEVQEIRRLYATGEYYQKILAKMFGVSDGHISEIVSRHVWESVE